MLLKSLSPEELNNLNESDLLAELSQNLQHEYKPRRRFVLAALAAVLKTTAWLFRDRKAADSAGHRDGDNPMTLFPTSFQSKIFKF